MPLNHRGRRNSYDAMAPVERRPWEDDPAHVEAEFHATPAEPPAHLSERMQAWWRTIVAEHVLESHEFLLLEAAAAAWDMAEAARAEIAREGMVYLNREGEPRPRPECSVLRDARASFAKLVKALNLDPPPTKRPGGHGFLGCD
jgi:phage terminase small subunit